MVAFHDAYLISLEALTSRLAPYLEKLQADEGYDQLRSDAIQLYESNSYIRDLLSDYGGWDKNSIFTQIPEKSPYDQEDVAFWLVILLYSELKTGLHQLGLGSAFQLIQQTLSQLGWVSGEIELLVKGRSFKDFAQVWLHREAKFSDYLNYIRPSSTSAWAGWIDHTEIDYLLDKLDEDEHKLLLLTESATETDSITIGRAYQSAIDMLISAKQNKADLCLIISG
jgi:hypothetical protein